MLVGPDDIDACAGGDVHLHVGRLLARVDWNGHGRVPGRSVVCDVGDDLRQAAVRQLDAAVGHAADRRRMGHHQNRVPAVVQLVQQFEHDVLVGFVEIAGGLVGQNQLGLIDQRARDGHALLLAAGKLARADDSAGRPVRRAPALRAASASSVML